MYKFLRIDSEEVARIWIWMWIQISEYGSRRSLYVDCIVWVPMIHTFLKFKLLILLIHSIDSWETGGQQNSLWPHGNDYDPHVRPVLIVVSSWSRPDVPYDKELPFAFRLQEPTRNNWPSHHRPPALLVGARSSAPADELIEIIPALRDIGYHWGDSC